jgi:hypothetical protein
VAQKGEKGVKPGTTEKRPLGIPAARGLTVEAALKHILEPIFEHDFGPKRMGEPDAGDPPVRFGGKGRLIRHPYLSQRTRLGRTLADGGCGAGIHFRSRKC